MEAGSPVRVIKLLVPVYQHSGLHDAELRFVASTLQSSILLKRLTTEKSLEIARPDSYYRNLMALHKNVSKKLRAKYYGTETRTVDTFSKCTTPSEVFHLKRRVETSIAHCLHRFGFALNAEMKPMMHGKDMPEIPMFKKFAYDHREEGKTVFASFRLFETFIAVNEWYQKGVEIQALGKLKIRPVYSVWSPTSQEYLNLFASYLQGENLSGTALDIGSGTGVLSFLLASKGLTVTAIDSNRAAVECTKINALSLGYENIQSLSGDITQKLDLPKYQTIVANPPWIPAVGGPLLQQAVFDEKEQMLTGCFQFVSGHLEPQGRFLLIYSDLAHLLGLQPENRIQSLCDQFGLTVSKCIPQKFPKQLDGKDPLKPYKDAANILLYDIRPR